MQVTKLTVKNFRCFEKRVIHFESNLSMIVGKNGSGKSTLIEALHYLCYLRSFRTYAPSELIRFGSNHFFIEAECTTNNGDHQIQVGCAGRKRVVKVDKRLVNSFKDLLAIYRAITIVEDDLQIIKGGPDERRAFIDQVSGLIDSQFTAALKKYKAILLNRNMLLKSGKCTQEEYLLWSTQLYDITRIIQKKRISILSEMETSVNKLIKHYFASDFSIAFKYSPKNNLALGYEVFDKNLQKNEFRYGRSLFGAHLDDFIIHYRDTLSRSFASRGQQKLIVILLKIAQAELLTRQIGDGALMLVDDFLTDFDKNRAQTLLKALHEIPKGQIILTSPLEKTFLENDIKKYGGNIIITP